MAQQNDQHVRFQEAHDGNNQNPMLTMETPMARSEQEEEVKSGARSPRVD